MCEGEVLDLAAHSLEERPLLRPALHHAHHALRLARRHDPVRQEVGVAHRGHGDDLIIK